MSTLKKIRGTYLLVLLAMCGLISSSLGIMTNAGGIFFVPIAGELGQSAAAVSLMMTVSNLAFAAGGIFCAKWIRPNGFRPAVVAFALLFAASTALLSVCRSMPMLYLFSGIRGFAAGLVGNVLATSVLGRWFLADTGFITSLALGCSGLVGALCNPLLETVIRSWGWRTAYLVSAGLILLLDLPAMVFPISFLPEDSGLEPLGSAPSRDAVPQSRLREREDRGPVLLAVSLAAVSLASMVTSTPQLFKSLAITYDLAQTGILMMSAVLVMNTAGKFLFGMMTDRMGVRRSILIYGTVIAAGILLLLWVRVPGAMLLSAAMIGLAYSIPTVGAVMICRELFSPEQYSRVFPRINLGASAANALGYPLFSAIYDRTGKYDGALLLALALILLSMAGVLLAYGPFSRSGKKS